jgi:hypothetical protein
VANFMTQKKDCATLAVNVVMCWLTLILVKMLPLLQFG